MAAAATGLAVVAEAEVVVVSLDVVAGAVDEVVVVMTFVVAIEVDDGCVVAG